MMYTWLLKYFKKPLANFLILCWYVLLLLLILYSAGRQQGQFRYLEW